MPRRCASKLLDRRTTQGKPILSSTLLKIGPCEAHRLGTTWSDGLIHVRLELSAFQLRRVG